MAKLAESSVLAEETEGVPSLTERIAGRFLELRLQDLSVKAREVAINDLIDMQNAAFGGWPLDRAQALLAFESQLREQRDLSKLAKVGA